MFYFVPIIYSRTCLHTQTHAHTHTHTCTHTHTGAVSLSNAHFGQGSGQIWLDDVNCYGYESRLDYCTASSYGNNNCHHYEDASVQCVTTTITTDCKSCLLFCSAYFNEIIHDIVV